MFVAKLYRQRWFSRPKLNKVGRFCLPVLLLLIMFLPAVYYNVAPGMYDRDSPVVYFGDVRLSPDEWQAVANFAIIRVYAKYVYGVRLAWEYVGGLGGKNVFLLLLKQTELGTFIHERRNGLFFLRTSMVRVPDYSAVTISDMRAMYATSNVLYSSGDVMIVVSP
jgi:hypothetical protein